jgi:hypothetical protein
MANGAKTFGDIFSQNLASITAAVDRRRRDEAELVMDILDGVLEDAFDRVGLGSNVRDMSFVVDQLLRDALGSATANDSNSSENDDSDDDEDAAAGKNVLIINVDSVDREGKVAFLTHWTTTFLKNSFQALMTRPTGRPPTSPTRTPPR